METRRHLMLIGAVACIASGLTFAFVGIPRLPDDAGPLDNAKNVVMARNVAFHGILSDDLGPPYHPSARRMPLYSLFLAGLLRIGVPLAGALAVQFALSVSIPVFTYFLGRDLISSRAGLATGILMALHPMQLAMPSTFDDAWFFEIFWLAGFLFFIRSLKTDRPARSLALAGLFLGLSGLIRPLTMTLWPIFIIGALIRHRRKALFPIAAFIVALGAIWTPWFVRNWKTFDTFFITTQDAYILAWDSYAFYLADTLHISHPEAKHRVRLALEEYTGRSFPYEGGDEIDDPFLNEPKLAAVTKRYVFSQIAKDPWRYAYSHLRHGLPFWTGSSLREFLASTPWYPKELLATLPNFTREITGGNWGAVRAGIARLGPWSALYLFDFILFFVILYGLVARGLYAFLFSRARERRITGMIFLFFFVFIPLLTAGVYIGPRYRFPLEPFFLILAGIGAVALWQSFSKYRHRAPRQVV